MKLSIQAGASLRGVDLPEALALLYDRPFKGVEVGFANIYHFGGNVEEFKRRLSRYKLELSGVYWSAPFHIPEERDRIMRDFDRLRSDLQRLGSRNVVIGPPPRFSLFSKDRERYVRQMAETLSELVERAGELELGVHNHWGTIIQEKDEIDLLMKTADRRVKLSTDIAHLSASGINVYEALEQYKDRVNYIHMKDDTEPFKKGKDWGELMVRFKVPGKGKLDMRRVLSILKGAGFNGWVTVEYEDRESDPVEDLKFFVDYFNRELRQFFE